MNLTLIFMVLILISMSYKGYKKGGIKEIINMISLIVTLVVLSLLITLYVSYTGGMVKNTIFTVVLLGVIAFIYPVVKAFLKTSKLLTALPVVKRLNKVLGLLIGLIQGFLVLVIIYEIVGVADLGPISRIIMEDTLENKILYKIYTLGNFVNL